MVDVQSFTAFGFTKAGGVDCTQAKILSNIESCSTITLDVNVSNDYAGYRFFFTSQC